MNLHQVTLVLVVFWELFESNRSFHCYHLISLHFIYTKLTYFIYNWKIVSVIIKMESSQEQMCVK